MDSQENLFVSLCSKNERLIGEMNNYLEEILTHSPAEESNCSNETEKTDNCTLSADYAKSSYGKLKIPPIAAPSSDFDGDEITRGGGRSSEKVKKKVRSSNENLNPIDENGGELNPTGEYEYFNDFHEDDDDSLVAMAQRMDAASIISDPSLICGTSEKFLALPQPKLITAGMKKLGQKMKPAPPPRIVGARVKHDPPMSPAGTPQQVTLQSINTQNELRTPAPAPCYVTNVSRNKRDPSPSSIKENFEVEMANPSQQHGNKHRLSTHSLEQENDGCSIPDKPLSQETRATNIPKGRKNRAYRKSTSPREERRADLDNDHRYDDSTNPDSNVCAIPDKTLSQETRATDVPNHKGRRDKSSRKSSSTSKERRRAARRGREKKNMKSISPLNNVANERSRGNNNGELPSYLPAELIPVAATAPAKGDTTRHKVTTKSRRKQREKTGSKRGKQKRDNSSDDETMCGIGFNTRIRDKPKNDDDPKEAEDQFQLTKQSQFQSAKKPHKTPKAARASPTKSQMEPFESSENEDNAAHDSDGGSQFSGESADYNGCEFPKNDNDSVYDSDDQTQIFYESTDDEWDSDEELVNVGTSVAQAVQDLNSKSAVAKVKNLFGIRG